MRVALIANPHSGGGDDPQALAAALADAGCDVASLTLDDLPRRAADADRIVVAGGDGSIGPAAALASRSDVALAVIPTGTANDFARALELPSDRDDAVALASRPDARRRRIDLADAAGGRPWLNCAAAGLSVDAAEHAKPLKRGLGSLAYAVGAARAALSAQPLEVAVSADGRTVHEGRAWQVIVAQTGAFGGGSAVGCAQDDDALLDVVVLTGSRAALARRAYGLRTGRIAAQDGVPHARGAVIDVSGPDSWNVDGEVCDDLGRHARFCVDGTVEIIVG